LFLPYKAVEIAALRRLISAWMRLSIFEAMNCEEGDQRLWFVVDELDALGEIDGLKDALARLRKFGGRCVLGFQSIAQVSGLYGKGSAETIVENCGNTLILRCSASERGGTSEFACKLIGQRDVIHTTLSTTRRSGEWRKSTSKTEQLRIEPAVMASEIERLPDLAGFLKIASVPDWQVATLTVQPDMNMPRSRARRVRAITPEPASAAPLIESASRKTHAIQRPMRKPRAHTKGTSARREPTPESRRVKPASQDSDTPNPR
jgi:type IV secretory pathway TraG/TraD family ATPase VirD4